MMRPAPDKSRLYLDLYLARQRYLASSNAAQVMQDYRASLGKIPKYDAVGNPIHKCGPDCTTIGSLIDPVLFVCAGSGKIHRCGVDCADAVILLDRSRVCKVSGLSFGYELEEADPTVSDNFGCARGRDSQIKSKLGERISAGISVLDKVRMLLTDYETRAATIIYKFLFSADREAFENSRVQESHVRLSQSIYRMMALEHRDSGRPVSPLVDVVLLIFAEANRMRNRNFFPNVSTEEKKYIVQRLANTSARLFLAFQKEQLTAQAAAAAAAISSSSSSSSASASPFSPTFEPAAKKKKKEATYGFLYHVLSVIYCSAYPGGVRSTEGQLMLRPVPMLDKIIPPEDDLNRMNMHKRVFSKTEVIFRKKLSHLYRVQK